MSTREHWAVVEKHDLGPSKKKGEAVGMKQKQRRSSTNDEEGSGNDREEVVSKGKKKQKRHCKDPAKDERESSTEEEVVRPKKKAGGGKEKQSRKCTSKGAEGKVGGSTRAQRQGSANGKHAAKGTEKESLP
ncbi:hypothetical protein BDP27DRAFT_1362768 [Rhodocollybia butyracea]|uniref:Uncharacterized protein n=1 Tax=Rhodocollybia butyracea TaxID=206335 RepID=A0A9P5U9M8_9AGAR|nr:hypothetical protein BDP27DRAFT_1362768 [Rhodocollybia butyracea]